MARLGRRHGDRASIIADRGDCAELERSSRLWLARAPLGSGPRLVLASALIAQDAPRAAAEEVWNQGIERMVPERREEARARGLARIAVHYGDVGGAEAAYRQWIDLAHTHEDVTLRLGPVAELATFFLFLGRQDDARALAKEHASREPALASDPSAWWLTPQETMMSPGLFIARAAGVDLEPKRQHWIAEATALESRGRAPPGFAWITGWARPAWTEEEAQRAIAERAKLTSPDLVGRWWPAQLSAWAGGALALAGDYEAASPLLSHAARACNGWTWSAGEHVRATYLAAVTAAKLGRQDEARTLLKPILERWPTSAPIGRAAHDLDATLRP